MRGVWTLVSAVSAALLLTGCSGSDASTKTSVKESAAKKVQTDTPDSQALQKLRVEPKQSSSASLSTEPLKSAASSEPVENEQSDFPFSSLTAKELASILSLLPSNTSQQPSSVEELLNEGMLEGQLVVGKYPTSPDAYEVFARMYLIAGEYQSAVSAWKAALRINPNFAYAHFGLGQVAARKGEFESASSHFTRAVGLVPNYKEAVHGLAQSLSRLGKLSEAEQLLTNHLEKNPRDPNALLQLGQALLANQQYSEAAEQFENAMEVLPASPKVLRGASLAFARSKQLTKAKQVQVKLLALQEKQRTEKRNERKETDGVLKYSTQLSEKLNVLGAFYLAARDFDNAERVLQRASSLAPKSIEPRQNLARLYFGLAAAEPAEKVFREMIDIEPKNSDHLVNYAEILKRLGRTDEAIEFYEKCVSLDRSAQHLYLYATTLHQVGQRDRALKALDEAITASENALELVQLRSQWLNER